jgi:geranylgeranyl reductase family protein
LEKFDVIVVGAGTAGCLTAKTVAEAGLTVCLVERKPVEEIGEKICGDAVGRHHFENLGLKHPENTELEKEIPGIRVYSPDLKTIFTVKGERLHGYVINRRNFGQRLLKEAIDAGANLFESALCLEPTIEKGFVNGVLLKHLKTGKIIRLFSNIVVDATGISAVLRSKLPQEMGIPKKISRKDIEACYREIRQLKNEDQVPEMCEIYLNNQMAPGGYIWIFPKAGSKVNVGLGVAMRGNFPNPKGLLYNHVLAKSMFENSLLLNGGAWMVPTRRPLDNMVGNGIIIVGDAACQVSPIHGGGIGPSMMGGYLAGKTIVEALENGDFSQRALWHYNLRYMEYYGVKQAGLDVFRIFLISCRDEDLNYGMKYKLITEKDLLEASMGNEIQVRFSDVTIRVFRGIKRVGLLNRLRLTASLMRKVRERYRNYPATPEGYKKWRQETERLFEVVEHKLGQK